MKHRLPARIIYVDDLDGEFCQYTLTLEELTGAYTFPYIFVDREFIGDDEHLEKAIEDGSLDRKMKAKGVKYIEDL